MAQANGFMILVAGPHRSGTGDDPEKMAANVRAMEPYALPLFKLSEVPGCSWQPNRFAKRLHRRDDATKEGDHAAEAQHIAVVPRVGHRKLSG